MKRTPLRRRKSKFFLIMGIVGLLAIFIGFSKPFIVPISLRTFKAPTSIYVHALFSFSWVLLFTIQAFFIQTKRHRVHIKLGLLGIFVAIGTCITLFPVAKFIVGRDLNEGLGESAYSSSVGLITTGIIFLFLVSIGLYFRKNVQLHKRLLLLATIVLLWPAWFRFRHFFPNVPRPDIWFGVVLSDTLIVVSWIWDKVQNKHVHAALLYGGLAIIIEQTFEVLMYDSFLWRQFGKIIYNSF